MKYLTIVLVVFGLSFSTVSYVETEKPFLLKAETLIKAKSLPRALENAKKSNELNQADYAYIRNLTSGKST